VREKRTGDCAAHAVALLKRARADGYFRVAGRRERMKSDPVMEWLRGRGEFEEFRKE
jgi:hypothetical protein